MENKYHISQDLQEKIERFLNQEMSIEELLAFENRMKTEPELKQQVQEIRALLLGIETHALKEDLNKFHADILEENHFKTSSFQTQRRTYQITSIAAILIVGLACFWFLKPDKNDALYNQYFYADPGLPTNMGSTDNYVFYEAMVEYKQGNYKSAINTWESQLEKNPKNDTLNYFIGVANLAQNEEATAQEYLTKITQDSLSVFQSDANFYLGLIYLKKNQKDQAIEALSRSKNEESKPLLDLLKND